MTLARSAKLRKLSIIFDSSAAHVAQYPHNISVSICFILQSCSVVDAVER